MSHGGVGKCGESNDSWHMGMIGTCATGHEHGDEPPDWVKNSAYKPMYTHPGNTPTENVVKHTSFKGFAASDDGVDTYTIMHLDTNPNGHSSRFHSVQVWAKDPSGGISHWDYWTDFGQGNNTFANLRGNGGCEDTSIRPIMSVNYQNCGSQLTFESWYSRAGAPAWGWDFGFNISPHYYAGKSPTEKASSDLSAMNTWVSPGMNRTRRIELAWYKGRDGGGTTRTGKFYSTQWGQVVNGPTDPICGTTKTYGEKTYPVLCIEQYIAPTMSQFSFPGNAIQKEYSMQGVTLPN
jgi:hypothetical protein